MLSRRIRRLLATLMLLQYAAATWIIPVAHAAFADDRPIKAEHVEQQGDKNCQPVHNHLECSAFGTARLLAATPRAIRLPDGDRIIAARRPIEPEGRPLPAATSSLGSRAPPLV
ncbi:MAG: hypothetical protein ACHQU1_09550 [Gemmatimonadales bacterium]